MTGSNRNLSETARAKITKAVKKYRKTEKGRTKDKRYAQSVNGILARKRYQQSKKGKATLKRYQQSEKGKVNLQENQKRFISCHPNQIKAVHIVNNAIQVGKLPRPNTLQCHYSMSKYKGVSWSKQAKKWQVAIGYQNKTKHFGYFDKEVKAAKAYDKAAKELFGKQAYVNFR